jgi:hypothetical protein
MLFVVIYCVTFIINFLINCEEITYLIIMPGLLPMDDSPAFNQIICCLQIHTTQLNTAMQNGTH